VPFSLQYPNLPVFSLLEDAARHWGSHTAAICFESKTTYAQLLSKSYQFAHALTGLGVKRGDRVGILLPNVPEYMVAACGVWMTGATLVQMSPLLVEEEIQKLLEMTGCRTVVTLDMLSPPLSNLQARGLLQHLISTSMDQHLGLLDRWLYPIELLRRGVPVRNGHRRMIEFDTLIGAQPTHAPRARIQPDRDAAIIQPTGGTTGSPKAVVLTHRNLLANVLQIRAWQNSPAGRDSTLAVLPFFHCYGLTVVMLTSIASAGTMILCPRFKPRTIAKLIQRHRPTILPGVPALYAALNNHLKDHPIDLSSVELSLSGASALDAQVRRDFEGHGVKKLIEAYGLSEASPVTHANPVQQGDRPGTIGLPVSDTLARVVDLETGRDNLAAGQAGELVVRGPQVMLGYLDDAAATAQVLRDGWLFTGDVATYDADGFFSVVDRKKDLIKASGYNVFPIEVEEVIRRHPGVSDAAVVGVPDPERGELVKAFVIPRPQSGLTVPELDQFCREHLAKHKQPRQVELCDELPRNFLGKVLRRQLRG
jgi:long-chain acyl-CoA synthetase